VRHGARACTSGILTLLHRLALLTCFYSDRMQAYLADQEKSKEQKNLARSPTKQVEDLMKQPKRKQYSDNVISFIQSARGEQPSLAEKVCSPIMDIRSRNMSLDPQPCYKNLSLRQALVPRSVRNVRPSLLGGVPPQTGRPSWLPASPHTLRPPPRTRLPVLLPCPPWARLPNPSHSHTPRPPVACDVLPLEHRWRR